MVWVVGIAFGLLLLFAFPRQMLVVLGLIVVAGGGLIGAIIHLENQRQKEAAERRSSVRMEASFNPSRCNTEFPILVKITNNYSRTLLNTNFSLSGFRDGFSKPIYQAVSYNSDKILDPGQSYEGCWQLPNVNYGVQSVSPELLNWVATFSYGAFRE